MQKTGFWIVLITLCSPVSAQTPGEVIAHRKIEPATGEGGEWGSGLASIGDLDGDGIGDLAVGAPYHFDDGLQTGAIWIRFLRADGSTKSEQKISMTSGGLTGVLGEGDRFGAAIGCIGDLDDDGVTDIAVGAPGDGDGNQCCPSGAVWILFLNSDGTVKGHHKISKTSGDIGGAFLAPYDEFGSSIAGIGDFNDDGIEYLAVGSPGNDPFGIAGPDSGTVYILPLRTDGTVSSTSFWVIHVAHDFSGDARFGTSVASLGDLNEDGNPDIIVGAPFETSQDTEPGSAFVMFLSYNGSVISFKRITSGENGFDGDLVLGGRFGSAVTNLGDIDGSGHIDVVIGAHRHKEPESPDRTGAMWVVRLKADGTVDEQLKITEGIGGFSGDLSEDDFFGTSAAGLPDLNGDGRPELAVGAKGDDSQGSNAGATWLMDLRATVWEDLGNSLGSGVGPLLHGKGSLLAQDPTVLTLTDAEPTSLALIVIGLSGAFSPLKGGVLVPFPDAVATELTSSEGTVTLGFPWPTGAPSQMSAYFQFWIRDPDLPLGWSASNALRGQTP